MARSTTGSSRRDFLRASGAAVAGMAAAGAVRHAAAQESASEESRPPNFIIIFTDDQGYADLGCFGAPEIRTPRLDRMAAEGMKFTDFYSAAPVCTPSRAALMTGCYAQRVSLAVVPRSEDETQMGLVLFPGSRYGLHPDEITIADILKQQGYATACVGKWHLGDAPDFLPTRHGFDSYYGIPYSNDMTPSILMRGETIIEDPVDQDTLTERYTQEAVRFIEDNKDRPFFLYLAHNMPHVPLHVSERFRGRSRGGLYGDVIECIDWSTGEILDALARLGLDDNTLVIYTSDNGPWLQYGPDGGLATPLRAGKGTTYEGGMRVPCIVRWPGHVPAGSECRELATAMDFLPTLARLAGAKEPTDRVIDGRDISPLMRGEPGATSPHEAFYYYSGSELHAVRRGPWKLRLENTLRHETFYQAGPNPDAKMPEALYRLDTDPGEQKNVLRFHPEVAEELHALLDRARTDLGDSRTGVQGANVRPVGIAPRPG